MQRNLREGCGHNRLQGPLVKTQKMDTCLDLDLILDNIYLSYYLDERMKT